VRTYDARSITLYVYTHTESCHFTNGIIIARGGGGFSGDGGEQYIHTTHTNEFGRKNYNIIDSNIVGI